MGKKGKRTNRKIKQRKRYVKQYRAVLGHFFESGTSSDEENSVHSTKDLCCLTCLNFEQSSNNYEPPVKEIQHEGLDVILVEGMQFKNVSIQYHATHALSVLVKYMKEEQLKNLVSRGLKPGIKAVLERDVFFIVQEGIEMCSHIAVKSSVLRNDIASWGSLRVTELLATYHSGISLEFTHSVTSFLQNLCYHKPIPEFVLKHVASSARFLLQHEDQQVRTTVLNVVFQVASNEDFIITFENSYMSSILQFFDSSIDDEARIAFSIVRYFVKQHNKNTDTLLHLGLVDKIIPFLARHSLPHISFEACLILHSLMSKKKYMKRMESIVDSGIVMMLLGLLDYDTPDYKDQACATLHLLIEVWKPRHAIKLADAKHITIMCDVLKRSKTKHCACVLALIRSVLRACSALKANLQLQQAMDLIKELKVFEQIAEFVNNANENKLINELAYEVYALNLKDVKKNSDEENHTVAEGRFCT